MSLNDIVTSVKFPKPLGVPGVMKWLAYLRKHVPLTQVLIGEGTNHRVSNDGHRKDPYISGHIDGQNAGLDYRCYSVHEPGGKFQVCNFDNPQHSAKLTTAQKSLWYAVEKASKKYFSR
jgi:hypothetical protein